MNEHVYSGTYEWTWYNVDVYWHGLFGSTFWKIQVIDYRFWMQVLMRKLGIFLRTLYLSRTLFCFTSNCSRPTTSFMMYFSPMKAAGRYIWKMYKWTICRCCCTLFLVLLLVLFFYAAPPAGIDKLFQSIPTPWKYMGEYAFQSNLRPSKKILDSHPCLCLKFFYFCLFFCKNHLWN
jgi:hypothetical protein